MKKIVTIGGGTGSMTVLSSIKNMEDIDITAIVAMTDDGGSTGVLVDELGVLPAGDARQCLIALSQDSKTMRKLFTYRFEEGGLSGHNFGNIFLAALEKVTGDFVNALKEASDILKIKGKVLPILDKKTELVAILKNNKILKGENEINHADLQTYGLDKLFLNDSININSDAKKEILEADYIIIGPGNQYCSILPSLSCFDTKEIFNKTKAKIIYISNLTNKKGHNMHFSLSNYVNEIESYIDKKIDIILFNNKAPTDEQIEKYEIKEGDGVLILNDMMNDERVQVCDLLSENIVKFDNKDKIQNTRSFIRHDLQKLQTQLSLIFKKL